MVIRRWYPNKEFPCLVQINYNDGEIRFYPAKNFQNGLDSYAGKLIAIFKCKPKQK